MLLYWEDDVVRVVLSSCRSNLAATMEWFIVFSTVPDSR